MTVQITDDELRDAMALAESTYAVFARKRGYYTNTINSHLRGKLGEIACARWFKTSGMEVEAIFRDQSRISECDIVASRVGSLRVDVKTWDRRFWAAMGRCVAAGQIHKLGAKADVVLWCVSPPELSSAVVVELVGWNSIAEILTSPRRSTGPAGKRQVDNFQVDTDKLKPLSGLLDALNG